MAGSPRTAKRDDGAGFGRPVLLIALAFLSACSASSPGTPSAVPAVAIDRALLAPAALRAPNLEKLGGLTAVEVVTLLGEPDFRRAEPPAELWQYRGAECVLDLFLYSEIGPARVVHSEIRERSGVFAAAGDCRGNRGRASQTRQSRL